MIPTFKPSILRKDMDVVLTCMVEEQFKNGETTNEFQKKLAKELNVQKTLGIREYQRAFELLLEIYDLEPGKKIALSPLAPGWIHLLLKKKEMLPVYLDVDPDRCTISAKGLDNLEEKADCLFIYHHIGYEQDMTLLEELEIPVLEDITEVLAARLSNEIPVSAQAGIFSLKENGYLAGLGSSYLYIRDRKDAAAFNSKVSNLDEGQLITDIHASLGQSQMSRLDKYNNKRLEIRNVFLSSLLKTKNKTFVVDEESGHIPYSFPVLLNAGVKEIFQYTKKKKIECSKAFENSILDRFPDEVEECPGARILLLRCVFFPLYPSLGSKDITMISKVLSTLP